MKKAVIIALIVLGVIVLGIGGIVTLGILYVTTAKDLPVTEADRNLAVTAQELEAYFDDYAAMPEMDVFEKLQYVDGSVELTYDYDFEDDEQPYIAISVDREITLKDARQAMMIVWGAMKLGLNIGDSTIDVKEAGSLGLGDASQHGYVTHEGELMGNLLVVRKGRVVYMFLIMGFYFEDWDLVKELIQEKLDLLDQWN